jgi:Heterokaryon incompatibility protein (HET)
VILHAENGQAPFPFAPVAPSFGPSIYHVLKKRIDECVRTHTGCGYSGRQRSVGTSLIDCEARCIIGENSTHPYVALSYVWGKVLPSLSSSGRLPTRMPNVIKDAISVTKALGFLYLWVDQYCIDQSDPKAKHDQIRRMDEIYNAAELTIVAAAGSDAEHGLPGVGTHPRTPCQQVITVKDITLVSTTLHPFRAIASSVRTTRGWTYQEAFFSRRLLVFTDEQIYYECSKISSCETLAFDVDLSSSFHDSLGGYFRGYCLPNGPFLRSSAGAGLMLDSFVDNVEQYSARSLTFEKDSLYAFAGVLKTFEKLSDKETRYPSSWEDEEALFRPLTLKSPQADRVFGPVYDDGDSAFGPFGAFHSTCRRKVRDP